MLSNKPSGNLKEIVFVDGFRFGNDTALACAQST